MDELLDALLINVSAGIVTNIFLPLRDGAIFFELRVVCGAVVVLFLF